MNSIKRHIPNSLTCCNLISGCIAIVMAFYGYKMALVFIIIGAVFDFFDGMVARLLHVSSPIGKELDSLADVVTFGVAPSMMVFTLLNQISGFGTLHTFIPYAAFLIAAFSGLRLAKFNLDERQTTSFIGLPTPANALFWGSLIIGIGEHIPTSHYSVAAILVFILLSSWILIAEIPLFALKFKQWSWHGNEIKYIFILSCLPILLIFRISGIAIIIVWYVVLSLFTAKKADLA